MKKQTLYFADPILTEIKQEAIRQDRSISWLLQLAWKVARDEIVSSPATTRPREETPGASAEQSRSGT